MTSIEESNSTLAITNDMTEKNPEYDKYLKEDDGDDGKEKKKLGMQFILYRLNMMRTEKQ